MCRIAIAAGNIPTAEIIEGFLLAATSRNEAHELNERHPHLHPDGWGVVTRKSGKDELYKNTLSIWNDPYLQSLKNTSPDLLLLHVRRASKGLPIDYDHTQPFQENRCYFAHNGTITDLVTEGGTSDSLLFFRKILGQIGKGLTPQEAFRENLQTIKNYTAINAILLGEKTSYILNKFTKNPRFFTMKYLRSDDFVIVSSERLSTVPGEWSELGDGRLLTVDCLNLNLSVTIV